MKDIALIGRARAGKDTVGARLVDRYGYTRLAFADEVRRVALDINPLLSLELQLPTNPRVVVRLQSLIADVGWEYAKDRYPEVRRFLQATGQALRDLDEDFWVRLLLQRLRETDSPVVVTDVRYPNEARALRKLGFRMVRIVRPSLPPLPPDAHPSETVLNNYVPDVTVINNSTLEDLYAHADALAY